MNKINLKSELGMRNILSALIVFVSLCSCEGRKIKTYEIVTNDGATDTIKAFTSRYANIDDKNKTDCILFIDADNATIGYYPLSSVKSFKTIE